MTLLNYIIWNGSPEIFSFGSFALRWYGLSYAAGFVLGAPVERGSVLFEVAPLDLWRLALQVDERDVDEVRAGQRGSLVLSAFPDEPVGFAVESVTPVATAEEGTNTFRVEAVLDGTPPFLRPGMEGVAKIEIDRRRLAWIWSHEVVDWVRLALWRWLP